jgi:1-acyl-sn-glycerol-3-phosphate acyltransferase
MKAIKILAQALFSVYGLLVFVAFLLLIFPLVVIASFFGKLYGGNFIYILCRLWANTCMWLWFIVHRNIYEAPHQRHLQYVFVFNHISYIDIPMLMCALSRQHFRVLGKAEMAKIPIFGFLYSRTVVMVERDNAAKRARSVQQLKSVIKKAVSVVIAPEGTFNTTTAPLKDFYDGAFRVAIETQTPIKPIVFLDAYDRLNYHRLLSLTPGKSRAVFLAEIPVAGLTTEDTAALKEKTYRAMEEALIRYKASWIDATTVHMHHQQKQKGRGT